MSCVICGGETKKTHKHKLFKTEIVSCSRCDFSFESNNNLSTTNTLLHQKQSVNSFGQNYRRNDYYIRVLKNIDKEIKINNLLEIGTPNNFDFLKKVNNSFNNIRIHSHDINKYEHPDYINFSTSKELFLRENIDIVFCIHVLEHIPTLELCEFVDFCKQVSKYFVFEVPLCENDKRIMESSTNPHYSFFSQKSIEALFGHGLEIHKDGKVIKFNNLDFKLY